MLNTSIFPLGSDALRPLSIDEDDELLQYAIQQSLMESGSEEDQVNLFCFHICNSCKLI